jgi:hypothetical protein
VADKCEQSAISKCIRLNAHLDHSLLSHAVPETHVADLRRVIDKIQFVMGRECPVRFHAVDNIPTNASGKYPYVVNRRNGSPQESELR